MLKCARGHHPVLIQQQQHRGLYRPERKVSALQCRFLTSASFAISIGLVSVQLAYCVSAPIVGIDPGTQVVSGNPGPGQYWGFNESHNDAMIGWTFNLQRALTVTQVGWYDDGQDGLSRAFQIGLWQDLSAYFNPGSTPAPLLGNNGITIPGGTTASLQGSWRVVPLPVPVNLLPGNYELAGLDTATTPDVIKYVLADAGNPIPPTSPGMTIRQFIWGVGPASFQMVDNRYFYLANGLELGPMLFTDIPEPSAFALFGLGAVAGLLCCRCKLSARQQGCASRTTPAVSAYPPHPQTA